MRYITTNDTNITFTDVDGKVKIVPKNRVYTHFNVDTVTFLLIERYDNEGICIFSTKAEDLEINGTTYTYEQLLDGEGISDLFSPTGLSFEIVEELPQTGEEGVIYLVPNEDETYTEYIWIADEERFELIGTTDVDLTNYYTKAQVDALIPTNVSDLTNDAGYITQTTADSTYATQVVVNEEIAARIQGDADINTTLGTKADKSDTYTKTQVDTALSEKANSADLATVATSGDYDDLTNKPTIPSLDNYYTKAEANTALDSKADKTDTYTKSQVDTALALKQDASTAFSGDYNDLSNKPDLTVYAESADLATVATSGDYDDLTNKPTIPTVPTNVSAFTNDAGYLTQHQSLDNYYTKSEVNAELADKQDTLTAGSNITIENNVISATGGTQQQADWNQSDTTAVDYIKNKPVIPDTSDFVTKTEYNPKEVAIANALTDLNENKADKTELPDVSTLATKTELNAKQDTLVSGTNIKTVNNQSILGSGNITIQGGAYYISFATIATTGITDADWDGIVAAIDDHRPIYAGYPRQDGGIIYYGVECMNKNVTNTEIVLTASDDSRHYFYTFTKNGSNDYSYTVDTRPYTTDAEKTAWNAKADASSVYTKTEIDAMIGDIDTILQSI